MSDFLPIAVETIRAGDEVELPNGVVVQVERVRHYDPEVVAERFYPERWVVDWIQGDRTGTLAIAYAGEKYRIRRAEPKL